MTADFMFQIMLTALIIAVWIDVARLHRRLKKVEELLTYTYYAAYYAYYQTASKEREDNDEEAAVVGDQVIMGDADKVKESCVLELVNRRGCVAVDEAAALCNVSKSFIMNKLYRRRKVVKIDKDGRVCPRE